MIGHELTALYGIDHAQSLALVLPGPANNMKQPSGPKLLQYAQRVWGLRNGNDDAPRRPGDRQHRTVLPLAGIGTRLSDYRFPTHAIKAGRRAAWPARHEAGRTMGTGGEGGEGDFGVRL